MQRNSNKQVEILKSTMNNSRWVRPWIEKKTLFFSNNGSDALTKILRFGIHDEMRKKQNWCHMALEIMRIMLNNYCCPTWRVTWHCIGTSPWPLREGGFTFRLELDMDSTIDRNPVWNNKNPFYKPSFVRQNYN